MDVNTLVAQAQDATQYEDQTVDVGGGFERETPPEGATPARFIGYVEVGKREQPAYQGKEKPDAEEVRLYFELNGKKHRREIEVDGEKKEITNLLTVKVTKKLGDKASFAKLLRKMSYGREGIKHMAQMLGEGFLITIKHRVVEATADKPQRTFANMRDDEGTWLIGAPSVTIPNEEGDLETKNIPVPEPTQSIRLLLWNNPTQEQWDSIFIDGTRTVKDEKGQEREVSKNWLQEDIISNAKNFEGSPLQALVGGLGNLDLNPEPKKEENSDPLGGAAATSTAAKEASPAPAAKDTPAPSTASADTASASEREKPAEKPVAEDKPAAAPVEEPKQTKQDTTGTPGAAPADVLADLGL